MLLAGPFLLSSCATRACLFFLRVFFILPVETEIIQAQLQQTWQQSLNCISCELSNVIFLLFLFLFNSKLYKSFALLNMTDNARFSGLLDEVRNLLPRSFLVRGSELLLFIIIFYSIAFLNLFPVGSAHCIRNHFNDTAGSGKQVGDGVPRRCCLGISQGSCYITVSQSGIQVTQKDSG